MKLRADDAKGVKVYFHRGMAVSDTLYETVEHIRRNLNKLNLPAFDIKVWANGQSNFVQGSKPGKTIWFKNRNGERATDVSPNTLLDSLKAGFIPTIE